MIEVRKLREKRNDLVIDNQLVENRRSINRNGSRAPHEGKPDPALCFFHLVAKGGFGGASVDSVTQGMTRTENTVFYGAVAESQGSEQGVG